MKKFLSLFLMITLILSSAVFVFAAERSDISFDTYESEENGNICVDVVISESGNPSMMQFCIAYDEEILDCITALAGDAFSGNNAPIINNVDGKIYFIWDSLTPLGPGGTMIHLEFVPKEARDTAVGIDPDEPFIVANAKFEEIGNITGSAEIDLAEGEPEAPAEPPSSGTEPEDPAEPPSSGTEPEDPAEPPSSGNEPENPSEPPSSGSETEGEPGEVILDGNKNPVDIIGKLETEAEITEDDKTVWESGDENVAVVEDGKVVAVSPGKTTITVKTEDGEKEASVEITVKEDGTIETVEVLTNNAPKKNSYAWIFIPIAVVLIAVVAVVLKKIKSR